MARGAGIAILVSLAILRHWYTRRVEAPFEYIDAFKHAGEDFPISLQSPPLLQVNPITTQPMWPSHAMPSRVDGRPWSWSQARAMLLAPCST